MTYEDALLLAARVVDAMPTLAHLSRKARLKRCRLAAWAMIERGEQPTRESVERDINANIGSMFRGGRLRGAWRSVADPSWDRLLAVANLRFGLDDLV